uniref:YadA-like family protein n=1 Tax=Conchiformibius kuhniae TaxID=211502 RepID=A0A8T9N110_9NEIS|nr:hypothetical protein LVJ77_07145 [Conchiformibius kuhniae]
MNFEGNTGGAVHKNLGEKLTVKGGHGGQGVSDKNTYVANENGNLVVKFAENPEFKGVKLVNNGNTVNLNPVAGNKLNLGGGNNNAPVVIGNVANGVQDSDAVNVSQLKDLKWKLDVDAVGGTATGQGAVEVGSQTVTVLAGNGIKVEKNGTNLTISSTVKPGAPVQNVEYADLNVGTDGKVATPSNTDGAKAVNATTVAKAINDSGWKVTSGTADGGAQDGNPTNKLVKAGDQVTLQAGKNLKVKQEDGKFTFGTQENVTFTHVDSNSVTIGKGSTPATTNPVTLTANNGVLKVAGNNDAAAKITNVAPADISETSKDAVNGSQLYALGNSVRNVFGGDTKFENGAVKDFKYQVGKENGNYGNQANNVTDAFKNLNDYVNEGIKVAQNDADKGKLTPTETLNFKDTDSVTGTVTANGDKVDVSFAVKTGKVKAENKKAVADDAAGKIATVADVADTVNNVAWSVQEKGAHKADVKAGSKVDFVDGDNTKVSVTHAGDTTTVKYSVDTGEVKFDPADNQAKAPDANKVAKAGDVANVTNAAVKHVVDTGMKFAGNDGNPVHKKLGETLNIEGGHNGTGVSSKNTYVSKDGDKLLVQFAENPEFKGVKLADGNHVVNLSPVEGNKLKLGGGNTNAPVTISNVADGVDGKDAVNVSQLNALKWKLDVDEDGGTATGKGASEVGNGTVTVVAGKGIGVKKDGNKVTISADVPEVSFADLSVGGDGKVVNPGAAEGGKSVNATTVANAINNSGWLAQAGAVEGGVVEGGDQAQLVKAGDKVTLQAGKNLKVKQDGNNFTFGTQETVTFTGVNSNTVTIGKGSDPATANPVTLTAKDGVLKVEANDGAAAKITNVAPADLSETSTDAVNGSQLYALGDSIRNVLGGDTKFEDGKVQGFDFQVGKEDQSPYGNKAGNVQDALTNLNAYINEGIKVGDNAGTEVAKLTPTDQLNFKDGDNTASKVEAGENGTVNVSFDVKTGSVTVGEDKKAVANEDSGKIATVGDVANAVNNVAWTLQEKGADKADIKAGSKVNFIDGDSTKVTIGEDNGATTVKYEVNTAALTGDVTFTDGKASTPDENKLAKTGDVANVTNKAVDHLIDTGMKFAGNDGAEIHKKLGETLNLEGGNDGAAVSDKNTYIANENGKLKVKFADNPEFKGIDLKDGGNTVKLGSTPEGLKLSNADGAPVSISNVSSGLNTHADGKPAGLLDLTGNGKNGAPVADNTAATVGDLRNMGWVISADKTQDDNGINNTPYSGQVKNAGEVKISGGDLVKVSGKNDNGVHTITVDLDAQNITNHAQLPVVYTDTEGNKVYKQPDGSFTKQPDGTGDKVNADDVIASMNSGGDDTKAPTTLANVKGNLNVVDDAGNKVYDATGEKEVAGNRTESTAVPELKANNAATVSDVVNAGWNLKANGEAKDFVRHSDTVDFVNGYGSNIVIDNKDGKTSSIRIDTPLSYTDGADVKNVGNKVMGEPTNSITLIGGNQDAPVRLHNVASGVGENLKDDAFVTALENATGSQLNNAVNVADLQNLNKAINTAAGNTGFNLNASKSEGGELGDSKTTDKRIGNGETMTLDAGKNIKITQIDNGFSVATSDNLNVVSVTAKDGDKTTKLDGNGLTITPATGGVVSLTGTGLDNGGNKIVNVADGKVAPDSKEAVNGSQLYQVYQVVGGDPAKTNFTTLEVDVVQPDGSVTKQKVPSSNGYTLTTYNVKDRGKYLTNNVIEAVGRMNEEGIKFFHTNDGVVKPVEQGKSTNDSSASGAYATAVGYKADASGESTLVPSAMKPMLRVRMRLPSVKARVRLATTASASAWATKLPANARVPSATRP